MGQLAVDVGIAGGQMGLDALTAALLGPAAVKVLMGGRSFGDAAQEARLAGVDLDRQLLSGLGSAGITLGTNQLSNFAKPFQKIYGKGLAETVAGRLASRFGDSTAVQIITRLSQTAAGRIALSALGEAGEENLEGYLQAAWDRFVYNPEDRYTAEEARRDALVAGILGALGGVPEAIGNIGSKPARNQAGTGTGAEAQAAAGMDAAQVQTGAQGVQAAPERTVQAAPVQQQKAAPGAGTAEINENGLTALTALERKNLSSGKKNKIVSTFGEAVRFIQNALTNRQSVDRAYLGKIPDSVAQMVLGQTGVDISGYQAMMLSDSVRHMFKNHGDPIVETARGQIPLSPEAAAKIPDILAQPDKVSLSPQKNVRGLPVLLFEKMIDGYYTTAQAVADGTHSIQADTLYIRKKAPQDAVSNTGKSANPEHNVRNVLPQEPFEGTASPSADPTIAQGADSVKTDPLSRSIFGDGKDGLGAADAGSVNSDYDRLQAQSDAFHPINESSAQRIMEEQHRAPSEVPTHTENGASIYKTVSTILNSPLTSPEMAVEIERAVADGSFDYIPVTDSDAMRRAQADLSNRGLQRVAGEFQTKVDLGQRITKNDMAAAIAAYNQAVADGDHTTAFDLMVAMSDTAHDSAQVVQTMNLMNRLTPEGRLLTLRRFVDKMNRRQNRRPGGTGEKSSASTDAARGEFVEQSTGFRISDELATNYLMAETDAERAAAWDAITTDIAKQIPSTFMDKANFWRYTSMLLNPTTHVRNTAGNLIQAGARTIKNGVGAAIERAVIQDQAQRTKSILTGKEGKDLKEFARGQYAADQDAAMGAGKYSDASAAGIEREIQSKRKAFNGDDVFSKGVQAVGDLNSNLLDMEDLVFNRSAYVSSFAQALKAKGVTAAEAASGSKADLVEAARVYAIEEARRATYRNTTALSEYLSEKGRYQGDNVVKKAASFAANAFLPFRRTPANILTTGMDYSPLGILKAVKQGTIDLKRGDCTAADVVDSLCAGLTGSGIMAVGMYLAAEGLLRVRAGDDDREETYNKDRGIQDYSLQIGNRSYTLDWAVPAAMPLFAGAAVMEAWQDDVNGFEAVLDAMGGISQVVLETSMLSSLNNLISNWSYADNKGLYLLDRTATGYAGQYVPTIGGKIASAADDTVRRSYVEKNTGQMASDADYFLQSILKKIPGARNTLQPKIDLWGEDVSNGTIGDRLVQSFISPGYLKTVDTGKLDQELRRLEEAVGRSSVYPSEAAKSFRLKDGSTKYLTAEEYTQYARKVGQTRKEILGDLIGRKGYQAMNDEEKAYVVDMVYDYAAKTAQRGLVGDKVEPSKWILEAMQSPLPPADVILYRARANQLENNEKVREEIFRDGGLSSNEKNLLDDLILSDGFYIPRDRNVDYSDRDSFAVSQMSDSAVEHWPLIREKMGNVSGELYGEAWEIFTRKGTKAKPYKKEQKIKDLQGLGLSYAEAAKLYNLMDAEVK